MAPATHLFPGYARLQDSTLSLVPSPQGHPSSSSRILWEQDPDDLQALSPFTAMRGAQPQGQTPVKQPLSHPQQQQEQQQRSPMHGEGAGEQVEQTQVSPATGGELGLNSSVSLERALRLPGPQQLPLLPGAVRGRVYGLAEELVFGPGPAGRLEGGRRGTGGAWGGGGRGGQRLPLPQQQQQQQQRQGTAGGNSTEVDPHAVADTADTAGDGVGAAAVWGGAEASLGGRLPPLDISSSSGLDVGMAGFSFSGRGMPTLVELLNKAMELEERIKEEERRQQEQQGDWQRQQRQQEQQYGKRPQQLGQQQQQQQEQAQNRKRQSGRGGGRAPRAQKEQPNSTS